MSPSFSRKLLSLNQHCQIHLLVLCWLFTREHLEISNMHCCSILSLCLNSSYKAVVWVSPSCNWWAICYSHLHRPIIFRYINMLCRETFWNKEFLFLLQLYLFYDFFRHYAFNCICSVESPSNFYLKGRISWLLRKLPLFISQWVNLIRVSYPLHLDDQLARKHVLPSTNYPD